MSIEWRSVIIAHLQEMAEVHSLRVCKVVHFTQHSGMFGGSTGLKWCATELHKLFSELLTQ